MRNVIPLRAIVNLKAFLRKRGPGLAILFFFYLGCYAAWEETHSGYFIAMIASLFTANGLLTLRAVRECE